MLKSSYRVCPCSGRGRFGDAALHRSHIDPSVRASYAGFMSFEVEVKYRSADHDQLRRLLLELGAREDAPVDQEDVYLRHPSRDFAQTHEALRLRHIGAENRITYKGPRFPGPTKTREE